MSLTLITARRVIAEVLRDRRTVALVLLVPSFMLWLMYLIYDGNRRLFDSIAVLMLGVFPMLMMFIIASVSMQRERSNGTLERLWTTRLSRIQFLAAYGISFSFFALLSRPCWWGWRTGYSTSLLPHRSAGCFSSHHYQALLVDRWDL